LYTLAKVLSLKACVCVSVSVSVIAKVGMGNISHPKGGYIFPMTLN